MARCEDCLHYKVCLNIESQHLRIILAGNKADERCKLFKPTADVVPKSEYDRLEKLFNDMTQEAKGYLNRLYGIRADVAREIFEEIEEDVLDFPMYDCDIQIILDKGRYDELKKKYTEEKKGED